MAGVLDLLKSAPMTNADLAHRLAVSTSTVHNTVKRLMAAPRQIHVCGWRRTGGRAFRLFGLGDEPDVPFEPLRAVPKRKVDMREVSCKALIDALAQPQSIDELTEALRCSQAYVRKYLTILRAETPRRIYVKEWRRPNGRGSLTQVFAAGSQLDAPRPRMTTAERFQEIKANPEKHERLNKLRRLAALRRRTRTKPQNVFSALGL
jgi:predicted ArsR family transcriptional regulator